MWFILQSAIHVRCDGLEHQVALDAERISRRLGRRCVLIHGQQPRLEVRKCCVKVFGCTVRKRDFDPVFLKDVYLHDLPSVKNH
jgi:hypothetical protein